MFNSNNGKQPILSIVVPAYNEELNLTPTLEAIFNANRRLGFTLHIIIINDGSIDNTAQVADGLARKYANVKTLHHKFPKGLGTIFNTAMILSEGDFFCLIPGDNQITEDYTYALLSKAGEADVVLSYPENMEIRAKKRRVFSRAFVLIYNFLFGLKLKYYNGPAVFDLNKLKNIDMSSRFFSYHAEYVTRFIRYGHNFKEVGGSLKERKYGRSNALNLSNLIGVIFATFLLLADIYYFRREMYCKK